MQSILIEIEKKNENYIIQNGRIGYKDQISNTFCFTTI